MRLYRVLLRTPLAYRVGAGLLGPAFALALGLATGAPAAGVLVAWLLAASVASDVLWRRIFNWVTGPALLVVVAVHLAGLLRPDLPGRAALPDASAALAGLGLCLGLMLLLHFAFRGGEGDVKLVALLGAVLGPRDGVEVAVAGYLLAALAALAVVAGRAAASPGRPLLAGTLPMAPFFALGALLCPPTFGGV